jgi:hypothetical protein
VSAFLKLRPRANRDLPVDEFCLACGDVLSEEGDHADAESACAGLGPAANIEKEN